MKTLALIFGRGGSKGLPGKNIRPMAGKPLIAWSVEAALKAKKVDRTIVSSDDLTILNIAEQYGAETMRRPKWMASGHVNLEPGIRHALETLKKKEKYVPDVVVVLQATSPLRTAQDIDNALALMLKHKAKAVLSVYEYEKRVLKTFIKEKSSEFMKPTVSADYPFMSRWLLPSVYMYNGAIHIIDTKSFLRGNYLPNEGIVPYVMTPEQSIDIDTLDDFQRIEKALKINFRKK